MKVGQGHLYKPTGSTREATFQADRHISRQCHLSQIKRPEPDARLDDVRHHAPNKRIDRPRGRPPDGRGQSVEAKVGRCGAYPGEGTGGEED